MPPGEFLSRRDEDETAILADVPYTLCFPYALTQFVGAIRGTESIKLTSFEDGVRYMAFTDAVTESLTTGREVPVEQA